MKFKTEKKELIALLAKTQNIVEKRSSMPVLINILLVVENNILKIFATDLEVSLTDEIQIDMIEPGKMGVNAKNLFEIIKELKEGALQLHRKENNWLEITQDKAEFNIVGIDADEYPVFPTYATSDFFPISSEILKEMIEKTIYSVSNDESRYHLNGVYFESRGVDQEGLYRMVATDGYRLSLVDRQIGKNERMSATKGVIIPRKGLNEIKKLLDNVDESVDIAIEGAQLILRWKTTVLMVRLIEGSYPNYQQLIPEKLTGRALIKRQEFLNSLKRVSLLSNQKSKGVTLILSSGKMEISSNNPELGDAKEEIEVDYQGSDIKIGFNARYILDILNSFDDESVDFEINDQLSPGLIRPHNDNGHTCIIMPMRI